MAAFCTTTLGEAETDLTEGRQVRRWASGAQALPEGASQALLGGPPRPVIESLQRAAAGYNPEDLSHLHHGVVILFH